MKLRHAVILTNLHHVTLQKLSLKKIDTVMSNVLVISNSFLKTANMLLTLNYHDIHLTSTNPTLEKLIWCVLLLYNQDLSFFSADSLL